ncbi:PDC sensor domain-containing protein [Paenibacillus agricola]|uniref:PDC sensor domain-containing protein n=1 Tax=Paenibacillus agricola TaxID=2716264 RepID=UPI001FB73B2B|nr:PDC sensor domain-containing protein [Paenibacillus agricola]
MVEHKYANKGFKLSLIISSVVLFSVIITLLINALVAYQAEKSSLYNNTLDLNRIHSNELSRTAQTIILSMKQSVKGTALYYSNEESSDEATQKQLDFLMSTDTFFSSMSMIDTEGTVRSVSPSSLGIVGQKLTSQASKQALELRKPLISEPYVSITKRMVIMVSHPIFDVTGAYKGYIAGSIYLQEANVLKKNIRGAIRK